MSAEPPAAGQSDRHGGRVAPGSDGAQEHSYAAGTSVDLVGVKKKKSFLAVFANGFNFLFFLFSTESSHHSVRDSRVTKASTVGCVLYFFFIFVLYKLYAENW